MRVRLIALRCSVGIWEEGTSRRSVGVHVYQPSVGQERGWKSKQAGEQASRLGSKQAGEHASRLGSKQAGEQASRLGSKQAGR